MKDDKIITVIGQLILGLVALAWVTFCIIAIIHFVMKYW